MTELSPGERKAIRWPSPAALALELSWGQWQLTPHLDFISRTIRDHIVRGNARLILTIPPRHGKSELCSVWLPTWYLAMRPWSRVGIVTYGHQFSAKWGRKILGIVSEHPDTLGLTPKRERKASNEIEFEQGGSFLATGIGGILTGHGLDLLIFDDPYKNRQEAESDVTRASVQEFWQSTARSRLEPEGSVVVIMQRWREDDLVGFLQSDESGETWTTINLPAVAEEGDPIGREPGEPLWPERYGAEALKAIQTSTSSYYWASQYQQKPAPSGGAIFKRKHFRYWTMDEPHVVLHDPDRGDRRVILREISKFQVADTAMKDGKTDDFTAVVTIGVTKSRDVLVLDVFRARLEVPDQLPKLIELRKRWAPIWQGVEDKGSGVGIIQAARRMGMPMRPMQAATDKVDRAVPASVWYENGMVYHPGRAKCEWLEDFEHELLTFPTGAHDDQVDALAYAIRELGSPPVIDLDNYRGQRATEVDDPRRVAGPRPEDKDHPQHERWKASQDFYARGGAKAGFYDD